MELTRLVQELKTVKQELRQLEQKYAAKNDFYQKTAGAYDNQRRSYEGKYGELLIFNEILPEAEERLTRETQRLNIAISNVKQTSEHLKEALVKLEKIENLLLQKNELFHFTADNVSAAILEVQIEEKTLDELQFLIKEMLDNAGKQYQCVVEKEKENQRHKDHFIGKCQNKIFDERMKQVVLTGIRNKATYLEFTDWHATIRERIAYSIRIAEGERKEHYTHIEQIIGQVHT